MSVNVVLNGVTYAIPDPGDSAWGQNLTDYFVAQASGLLQKAGGLFTLTAEVDFGATYGLKSTYFKSRASNPANAGQLRLGNTEGVYWRNAANGANLALIVNSSNQLEFNGSPVQASISVSDTSTIDLTLASNTLSADIVAGSITNTLINASAAITYSKLALTGAIVNADINASAAIAYSKLALTGAIVNADVSASAAIAYSKLALTGSIVNADVNASAAIAVSKLAALTASRALVSDGSGFVSVSTTTATELGYVHGVTSAVQTQLDGKQASGNYITALTGDITASGPGSASTTYNGTVPLNKGGTGQTTKAPAFDALSPMSASGDMIYGGTSGTGTRLAKGSDGQFLSLSSGLPVWASAAAAPTASNEIYNLGLAATVGSNALTIALKQANGSSAPASGTGAVLIGFRSSTLTTGGYNERSVTGALSIVVSSGSTLGTISGQPQYVYVYAIDNAGTVELAVSNQRVFDEGGVVSTTAEGGAGAADSAGVLYSTTARSNVPVRLIGRVLSTQSTAGTWAASPTSVSVMPFEYTVPRSEVWLYSDNGYGGSTSGETCIKNFQTAGKNVGTAITYTARTTTTGDKFTINEDGVYSIAFSAVYAASAFLGISVNSSQLSTDISTITAADRRALGITPGASATMICVVTLGLNVGDIVRAHTAGTAASGIQAEHWFRITKVSN